MELLENIMWENITGSVFLNIEGDEGGSTKISRRRTLQAESKDKNLDTCLESLRNPDGLKQKKEGKGRET